MNGNAKLGATGDHSAVAQGASIGVVRHPVPVATDHRSGCVQLGPMGGVGLDIDSEFFGGFGEALIDSRRCTMNDHQAGTRASDQAVDDLLGEGRVRQVRFWLPVMMILVDIGTG